MVGLRCAGPVTASRKPPGSAALFSFSRAAIRDTGGFRVSSVDWSLRAPIRRRADGSRLPSLWKNRLGIPEAQPGGNQSRHSIATRLAGLKESGAHGKGTTAPQPRAQVGELSINPAAFSPAAATARARDIRNRAARWRPGDW